MATNGNEWQGMALSMAGTIFRTQKGWAVGVLKTRKKLMANG